MNTQSSYVYEDHIAEEGLGRIALPLVAPNRFMPAVKEPIRNNRRVILPTLRKSPMRRVSKPKPVLKPTPIIDHNPVPPPRLNITAIREAAQKKSSLAKTKSPAKTTKGKLPKAVQKKANTIAAQKKGGGKGILDGSISIGDYEIKKTHAAVAGGATAGGLLLLKLLL